LTDLFFFSASSSSTAMPGSVFSLSRQKSQFCHTGFIWYFSISNEFLVKDNCISHMTVCSADTCPVQDVATQTTTQVLKWCVTIVATPAEQLQYLNDQTMRREQIPRRHPQISVEETITRESLILPADEECSTPTTHQESSPRTRRADRPTPQSNGSVADTLPPTQRDEDLFL